jgi:hypothetical protein
MALTDIDLRELFAERTATTPADSAVARVGAVGRRVRVIRRRRAAGVSLGVVVLLMVVTGISALFRGPQDQAAPVPAYQQKVSGGLLPRYNAGGEATAYTTFSTDDKRDATFTFTPTSLRFFVGIKCDKVLPESHIVSVEINAKEMFSGSCNSKLFAAGPAYGKEQAWAKELGVQLGVPATVKVRIAQVTYGHNAGTEKQPVYRGAMADYRVGVGVYSPIAIDDYPLPPRPHKLASLDQGPTFGKGRVLGTVDSRSVGANGEGAVSATVTPEGFHTEICTVAPGAVSVTVAGVPIDLVAHWTWISSGYGGLTLTPAELRKLGIDVKTGTHIDVVFTGARFTVAGWRADVRAGG